MMKLFKKLFTLLLGTEPLALSTPREKIGAALRTVEKSHKPHKRPFSKLTERELIQLESDIGARLFGEVPKDHRREFFNLDLATWIWYDEWIDPITGQRKSTTIRYEVHENGILKVQEAARYVFISGQELENFMTAIHLYYERVAREVYHADPTQLRHAHYAHTA